MSNSSDSGGGCGCVILLVVAAIGAFFYFRGIPEFKNSGSGKDISSQYAANAGEKRSGVRPAEVPVLWAIDQDYIHARVTGEDFYEVYVELTALTQDPFNVHIPKGTILMPRAKNVQPMVTAEDKVFEISATKSLTSGHIKAASMSMKGEMPTRTDEFYFKKEYPSEDVRDFVKSASFIRQTPRIRQFALWVLTDDLRENGFKYSKNLGNQGFDTGPTKEDLPLMKTVLEDSGIGSKDFPIFASLAPPAPPSPTPAAPKNVTERRQPSLEPIADSLVTASYLYDRWKLKDIGFGQLSEIPLSEDKKIWRTRMLAEAGWVYQVEFYELGNGQIFRIVAEIEKQDRRQLDQYAQSFFLQLTDFHPLDGSKEEIYDWLETYMSMRASQVVRGRLLTLASPTLSMRRITIQHEKMKATE